MTTIQLLPRLLAKTTDLLRNAPHEVELVQLIQGHSLRLETLDRLASRQAWPLMALLKGSGAEAAFFARSNQQRISAILSLALATGESLTLGPGRLIYADLRIERRALRWRSKLVGLPMVDIVAETQSEMRLLIDQIDRRGRHPA